MLETLRREADGLACLAGGASVGFFADDIGLVSSGLFAAYGQGVFTAAVYADFAVRALTGLFEIKIIIPDRGGAAAPAEGNL